SHRTTLDVGGVILDEYGEAQHKVRPPQRNSRQISSGSFRVSLARGGHLSEAWAGSIVESCSRNGGALSPARARHRTDLASRRESFLAALSGFQNHLDSRLRDE